MLAGKRCSDLLRWSSERAPGGSSEAALRLGQVSAAAYRNRVAEPRGTVVRSVVPHHFDEDHHLKWLQAFSVSPYLGTQLLLDDDWVRLMKNADDCDEGTLPRRLELGVSKQSQHSLRFLLVRLLREEIRCQSRMSLCGIRFNESVTRNWIAARAAILADALDGLAERRNNLFALSAQGPVQPGIQQPRTDLLVAKEAKSKPRNDVDRVGSTPVDLVSEVVGCRLVDHLHFQVDIQPISLD